MRYIFFTILLLIIVPPVLSDALSGMSLDETVSRVREQTQGRVLSAETTNTPAGRVHAIRVLTPNGLIKRVRVDAATGQLIDGHDRQDRR